METQQAISSLLSLIRERGYESGERMPSERELSERFNVSRGILREALATLEAMRVLERRPQSGIYIKDIAIESSLDLIVLESELGLPVSAPEVADLNEFRSMLEVQAVTLACQRSAQADIERLDLILSESRARYAVGQSLSEQDAQFHIAMCAASNNKLIQRAANSFWLASRARREFYFKEAGNARRSIAQHTALRNAIAKRELAEALDVLAQHLGNVQRYWISHLDVISGKRF